MKSKNIWDFYHFAKLNRISYYFLYKIREHGLDLPHKLAEIVRKEDQRYRCIMEEFVNFSSLLDSFDVDFAIFKSLKPFPSTTVDIDIVVFMDFTEQLNVWFPAAIEFLAMILKALLCRIPVMLLVLICIGKLLFPASNIYLRTFFADMLSGLKRILALLEI